MREPSTRSSIKAVLQGGLGNQLFIMAAALEQAHRLRTGLQLLVPEDLPHGGSQLKEILGLSNPHQSITICDVPIQMVDLPNYGRLPVQLQLRVFARSWYPKIWRERSFSYDSAIQSTLPGTYLLGYFQSDKYFNLVGDSLIAALWESNSDSANYHEWEQNLRLSKRSIGLHLRRGDYLHPSSVKFHGVPSAHYYREAVRRLRLSGFDGEIFLFSDDPMGAREYFRDSDAIVIPNIGFRNSLEVMKLLALTGSMVLSNSSFSWWAAALNSSNKLIYAPYPWHVNLDMIGTDVYRNDWNRLDSSSAIPVDD